MQFRYLFSDKNPQDKTKAIKYLDRLNKLLQEEQEYWEQKKVQALSHENSFWEEIKQVPQSIDKEKMTEFAERLKDKLKLSKIGFVIP